jgi:adenylate kinase
MSVTVVAGVPGVGVSVVCEQARKSLDGHELLNFGDAMLEQAVTHGLASTRSELASLSRRETERLQRRAGEYVADRAEETDVVLSTHLAVETRDGVLPGFPGSVLQEIDPDRIVLVEAAPETILDRRATTDREYEDQVSLRRIDFMQDLNRSAAFDYAVAADAVVELVENDASEGVEDAAGLLADVVAGRH